MPDFLMVPVHLDALYLQQDERVGEATVDFSLLPYVDGISDRNADTAYISENLVSQPFQNQNLSLRAGLHLHWSLPETLSRSLEHHTANNNENTIRTTRANKAIEFPGVPNIWLIIRQLDNQRLVWVIESDYLYPPGTPEHLCSNAVCYPIHSDPARTDPPFRYMGRALPLNVWLTRDQQKDQYLSDITANSTYHTLTAIGYGDPTYAAFYPNCKSIFGFYDSSPVEKATYTVAGWYREPGADFLQISAVAAQINSAADLQNAYQWQIKNNSSQLPKRLLCFAQAELSITASEENSQMQGALRVAVGNTGTEALSTLLAHNAQTNEWNHKLEEQLESLHLLGELDHHAVDRGPKFREARHAKGFHALEGGVLWSVRPVPVGAKADAAHAQAQVTLPVDLAHDLNTLNLAQQRYDRARFEIESMREQLFADWYKYMLAKYPSVDEADDYPDIDEIRYFIQTHGLHQLQERLSELGYLIPEEESAGKQPSADSQLNLLAQAHQRLLNRLPELQYFTPQDIKDPAAFKKQVIARHESLFKPLQNQLTISSVPEDLASKLNDLLAQNNLHNKLSFTDKIPQEAALLMQQENRSSYDTQRYNRLLLQDLFPTLARRAPYELHANAAPRYWQANEPVVLLNGPGAIPAERFSKSNPLPCRVQRLEGEPPQQLDALLLAIAEAKTEKLPAFNTINHRPWNPIMLEWEFELYPVREQSNLDTTERAYANNFITRSYALDKNESDLHLLSGKGKSQYSRSIYQGRTILTPQAHQTLLKQLDDYLGDLPADAKGEVTDQLRAIEAQVKDLGFHTLAQSLSGFNAALLGHKQTMQLPIIDPLGFSANTAGQPVGDDFSFAWAVSEAIDGFNRVAPVPLNDFHPIRSGVLRLSRLRLIDSFGRVRDVSTENICFSMPFRSATTPGLMNLCPRLAQPARLNLRWLANEHTMAGNQGTLRTDKPGMDPPEMNSHPASSPIQGWVVPNNLDNSLLFYAQDGTALGLLNRDNLWQPAPGSPQALTSIEKIANPHLRRVVQWIRGKGQAFMKPLISNLDAALENVNPANFAEHLDLALLMGRPVAVTRLQIGIELKGLSAINHDWLVFRQDIQSGTRSTDGVGGVHFPIRLGEQKQLNDGLIGYWLEDSKQVLSTALYSPQSDVADTNEIVTYGNGLAPLELSLEQPPITLTALVDPRAKVHATSGILPTKIIDIPPDQYAVALRNLSVTFFSAPILTTRNPGQVNLPLPAEPGYNWSWLEAATPGADGSRNWKTNIRITPVVREANLKDEQALREGWLVIRPEDKSA